MQYQGWSDNYISNSFSYQPKPWLYSDGGLDLHETVDPLGKDVREVRLWLGQGFILPKYFSRIHLDNPYFYMKLDQRFLWYPEEDIFDAKTRLRLRLGSKFSFTNIHLRVSEEDAFFLPFYFEGYLNFAGHAIERYASTVKLKTGVTYLYSNKLRFAIIYWLQDTKDTAGDSADELVSTLNAVVKFTLE